MCYPEFLIDYERTALLGWLLWTPTKICSENAWAHPSSLEKQLHFWWVTSIRFVFAKYISISIFPKMRGNLQPQNKDFNLLSFWFLFISRIFQIGLGDSQLCIHLTYGFQRQSWLVVDLPLWKIWKPVGIMTFPTEWKVINFHGFKAPARIEYDLLTHDFRGAQGAVPSLFFAHLRAQRTPQGTTRGHWEIMAGKSTFWIDSCSYGKIITINGKINGSSM